MKKFLYIVLAFFAGAVIGVLGLFSFQEIARKAEQSKMLSTIAENQNRWVEETPSLKEKIMESWSWKKVTCTLSGLEAAEYPMDLTHWKLIDDYFHFTRIVLEKNGGADSTEGWIKFCKTDTCLTRSANFGLRFITVVAQSIEPGSALLNVTFNSELGTVLTGSIFQKVPSVDDLGSDYKVVGHCEVLE